jgi:hypothetical protein
VQWVGFSLQVRQLFSQGVQTVLLVAVQAAVWTVPAAQSEQAWQAVFEVAEHAALWKVPATQVEQVEHPPALAYLPSGQLVHVVADPLQVTQLASHAWQTVFAVAEHAALWKVPAAQVEQP